MTKDVMITIRSLHTDPQGEVEPIETITTGEYFCKNGKHYVLYEEAADKESAITKSRIKLDGERMELTKRGPISTEMHFEEGKKQRSHYHTPYGSFLMGIDARKLAISVDEDEIRVEAEYVLEADEAPMADCKIKILIQSKKTATVII